METPHGTALLERTLPPGTTSLLWVAFGLCWTADMLTAMSFFLVSSVTELNPVTVLFYYVLGLPGVVLAATCYAWVVVAVVRKLPAPFDTKLLTGVTVLYAALALHNISVLVWEVSLLGLYTLASVTAMLAVAVSVVREGGSGDF